VLGAEASAEAMGLPRMTDMAPMLGSP